KAREQVPVELWMYGAGDFLTEVRALATELKLDDHAHFSGTFFPVEQIPVIVSGMDLGIIGNRRSIACDKYMLPVKLLEYVYLGVPVIAPRLDVISRYFDDHMVRFYEPENVDQIAAGIVELYKNKEERERLANAATSFYQKHSIQAQADVYLNLITGSPTGLRAQSQGHA
ncbi:MAG TPA: glycosyltransferase, partial [Terriglobales bacterium]|nr:glycosyltransferase [Terriglobales bacterium]